MENSSKKNFIENAGKVVANQDSYSKYYVDNFERSGSPKDYDLETIFRNPQGNVDKVVQLARYFYAKVGIIMRVINIIRDFGVSGYKISYHSQNDKVKEVITNFNKAIGLNQLLADIIFEIALTGNCVGYNRGKRVDIYPLSSVEVTDLIIDNSPVLLYLNDTGFDAISLFDQPALQKKLNFCYPSEVARGIKQGKMKIMLDTDNSFMLKVNSSRYEKYGIPFTLPAFDDLSHKTVLKEAERATAIGIIEKILRVSIGDKDNKPQQPHIDFYDNLINGKKGAIKATVPYFVNMEWIEPSTDIFGKEKFEQVDIDILNALGVSLTLISGQGGGNYSEAFISIAGLIKTIEYLRMGIPSTVNKWYQRELIRNKLNPNDAPTFEFNKVIIDDAAKLELLKWLFTSAGLPYEVLYNEAGYDYASVKLTRENENTTKVEDTFKLRQQPFQGQAGIDTQDNKPGNKEKPITERKTDKKQSNNEQPRPSK